MRRSAFTLIETLIGITLITVVMTAVTGLILTTLNANQRNLHTLQAMAYAQEGVEVMRYVRDSNWLQNYAWAGSSRRAVGGAAFDPALKEGELTFYLKAGDCPPCWSFSSFEEDGALENAQGFAFNRRIEVQPTDQPESAEIRVIVEWTERLVPRQLELSTILSNWK